MDESPLDEMQAGQEIDVLVAEKVMGWAETISDGLYTWRDIEADDSTGEFARQKNVAGYEVEDIKPWSPSTNIAAAWRVFLKLTDNDTPYVGKITASDTFACHFLHCDEALGLDVCSEADDAPLAICRAALKVVEG